MSVYKLGDIIFNKVSNYIGEKAKNLSIMISNNIPVPYGICLFDNIVEQDINEAWEIMSNRIPVAVRSSMSDEDNCDLSSAGKYSTFLGIKSKERFVVAVKTILEKSNSTRKCVIVQEMINSEYSGVAFTMHDSQKKYHIESSYGLGELIVSGLVTPDTYILNKDFEIVEYNISNKKCCGVFLDDSDKKIGQKYQLKGEKISGRIALKNEIKSLVTFDYYNQKRPIMMNYCRRLSKFINDIENLFGEGLDIEFAVSKKNIYILQARKITRDILFSISKPSDKKEVIVGKTASIGKITGEIVYSVDKCKEINKKYILVTPLLLPDVIYSDSFQKVSGLIVETGSILCHAAIVARELEIPCLVGIQNVYDTFKENTIVELNASESYAIIRGENL